MTLAVRPQFDEKSYKLWKELLELLNLDQSKREFEVVYGVPRGNRGRLEVGGISRR